MAEADWLARGTALFGAITGGWSLYLNIRRERRNLAAEEPLIQASVSRLGQASPAWELLVEIVNRAAEELVLDRVELLAPPALAFVRGLNRTMTLEPPIIYPDERSRTQPVTYSIGAGAGRGHTFRLYIAASGDWQPSRQTTLKLAFQLTQIGHRERPKRIVISRTLSP